MTSTTWRADSPARAGWHCTDRDDDLLRYFDGTVWSAPVHRDDLARFGDRVRLMPAEAREADGPVEWRDD